MISEHRMFRCSITYQVNTTVAVVRFSNTSACKELNLMPRETPSSRGLFLIERTIGGLIIYRSYLVIDQGSEFFATMPQ